MQGIRRYVIEMQTRDARVIELCTRMNSRMDELFARVERGFAELASDLVLLENRTLSSITELRNLVERVDDQQIAIEELLRSAATAKPA